MITPQNRRRIWIYIAFAFGISWSIGLAIYLRGGLANSRLLGPGLTEALLLTSFGYMFGPALAHVLTRLLTREGWKDVGLRPRFRTQRGWWLLAWLGTAGLVILGAAIFFALSPGYFDSEFKAAADLLASLETQTGEPAPFPASTFLVIQFVQAILMAPILNAFNIFGEEFGWRAYLQPKLLPLGWRKAMLWMGLIWGIWHWPLVLMGHGYGLDYPGAPWMGLLAFTWFIFVTGVFFGWLAMRGRSIWPAVIAHGLLNGLAPGVFLFMQGNPNPLLGPSAAGLVGGLGLTIAGLWLLFNHGRAAEEKQLPAAQPTQS